MALSLERVSTATEISDDLTRIRNENYTAIEVEVNAKPDLGEVTGTAYDGAKGKANADGIDTVDSRQDVILENKILNGTFDTSENWTLRSRWSISNGKLNFESGITSTGSDTPLEIIKDNYYYISFDMSDGDGRLLLQTDNYTTLIGYEQYYIGKNGILFQADTDGTILSIVGNKEYVSFSLDNLMSFNLTDIFAKGVVGTGKEPNAELMKKFIEQTGYFTIHTMTNKEIALAYSEYLKDQDAYVAQIASAVVALGGTI